MNLTHVTSYFPIMGGDFIRKDSVSGEKIMQPQDKWYPKDNVIERNNVVISEEDGWFLVEADICLKTLTFVETMAFQSDVPSYIDIRLDQAPKAVVAYYLFKDWWTRPAFTDSLADIPNRTELLLIQTEDGVLAVSAALNDTAHLQFVPSEEASTIRVQIRFTEAGRTSFEGPVIYAQKGKDPYQAMEGLMEGLCEVYQIPIREERTYPTSLEGLGWCSWDAFYRDVNAEKLLAKCEEVREKEIPFRWMMIDDGWQSVDEEERMTAYVEDRTKFPEGMKTCVEQMKDICDVDTVGVWHAFSGYWSGVKENSPLYFEQRENLVRNGRGQWIPTPDMGKAFAFYSTWHQYLKSSGIDLLKVDSQSTLPVHYRGMEALAPAARALHQGLDASASVWMNGNLINCMGLAKENVFSRPRSAVSRNSDDFFPRIDESFDEHLLQNAYNSLYHNCIYYTDWDMFWTSHPKAEKHAVLRAISGGPIYVSDQVGETRKEVLDKLCYADGQILRASLSAVPTEDCIFVDPAKRGYLKLKNECSDVRYLAAYFYEASGKSLDEVEKTATFTPNELKREANDGEEFQRFAVYNVFSREGMTAERDETIGISFGKEGHAFYAAAPIEDGVAVFGRSDKYLMSHAIERILQTEDELEVILSEEGEFLFYSEREPAGIYVDEMPVDFPDGENGFYHLAVDGTVIRILFSGSVE